MNFIALDLSSSVCGYTIYVEDKIDKVSYLKFENDSLIERGAELQSFLEKIIIKEYAEKNIHLKTLVIEANMKSFSGGKSSGDAMFKTGQMNFLGRYLCAKMFNLNVVELNVISARNMWYPGFTKIARAIKTKKDKEIVFELALPQLKEKGINVPTKILKSGIRKGQEVYLDEAYDMVDSYVLAEAFRKNNFEPILSVANKKGLKKKS